MEPLHSWTVPGDDVPMTITIHRPAVTIRLGNGPEAMLTPDQVRELSDRMVHAENYFDTNDPEVIS